MDLKIKKGLLSLLAAVVTSGVITLSKGRVFLAFLLMTISLVFFYFSLELSIRNLITKINERKLLGILLSIIWMIMSITVLLFIFSTL